MEALSLLPFLAARRSAAVILAPASPSQTPFFRVAWANSAWRTRVAVPSAGKGAEDLRLEDGVSSSDAATIHAALAQAAAAVAADGVAGGAGEADEEVEVELEEGKATLTLLRKEGFVVLSLPTRPQRPTPGLPLGVSSSSSTTITDLSTKPACFIDEYKDSEMGRLIAAYPWENRPISTWPVTLKITTARILSSPFRTYISWGHEGIFIYNDAYISAAQGKHPRTLGMTVAAAWPEVWDALRPNFENSMNGGVCFFKDADLPLSRNGFLEESFHTYSFTTTSEVLSARRLGTVQDLVESTSGARTVTDFCDTALQCLSNNPYDLPFVLLYTLEAVDVKPSRRKGWAVSAEQNSIRSAVKLTLRGSVGVPASHPFHIQECYVDLSAGHSASSDSTGRTPNVGFSWPFEQAVRQIEPVFLDDIAALADSLPGRAWGTNPRQAIVQPIWTDGKEFPAAVLIFGVNPRSAFHLAYKGFSNVVSRHVGIGLLSVTNAEADVNRANELLALDRAKTSFFSSTSHELRTPLTLIAGPLEDILNGKDLARGVREKLEMINRNANRLLNMINKLLDFSALEGGRTKTVFRPVDLGLFTTELASLFRDAVERGGLTFEVECAEDPPTALPTYISRDLYRNVIFNLLGNAIKYCPSGTITVRVRSTLAECALEISDTGVGIPTEELGKIFERFHRVENIYHTAQGTGIGLALTLEVVKTMGGQLEVTSEVGEGSTFSVKFRRGYTHLPSEQVSHHRISEDDELERATSKLSESEIKEATSYRFDANSDRTPYPSSTAESQYSAISDLSPVGIFQINELSEIQYTNARWHEISGHPPDRPLSEWMEAVVPEDLHLIYNLHADVQASGSAASIQYRYRNGRWAQLEFRKVDAFGPSVAFLGTVTDLTNQKRLEALHLETVEQRAADADTHRRQIEAFIDVTSHELRNPLSGVWQNAETVKASLEDTVEVITQMQAGTMPDAESINELAEEMKENLEGLSAILLCAAHQGRIADDILNVSKLNMGLLTVNRTPFDLTVKLQEVVTMFEAECHAKGIGLHLVIDDAIQQLNANIVIADPSRVAQVVVNLLLNSSKFTPFGGRITLSATASPSPPPVCEGSVRVGQTDLEDTSNWISPLWITVNVEDSGKGLTQEEMQVLFQRFAQINPRTDQYGGAGLGLYLSKSLIELHHGWIEVSSQPGQGSSFRFAIPVERGVLGTEETNGRRPSLANRRTSSDLTEPRKKRRPAVASGVVVPQGAPGKALHILVVEDNEINQKVLKRQLTNRHYAVTVAGNGKEALDILQSSAKEGMRFDAILMDLEMPIMGGLEAIQILRAREASEGAIPYGVIAVTGNARQEQIDTYLGAGFTDVAIKPYSFKDLVVQIEHITRGPGAAAEGDRASTKRSRV
ncbi:hypothetical protein RQP46_001405 [Phenoliferia psychrophenolica]